MYRDVQVSRKAGSRERPMYRDVQVSRKAGEGEIGDRSRNRPGPCRRHESRDARAEGTNSIRFRQRRTRLPKLPGVARLRVV